MVNQQESPGAAPPGMDWVTGLLHSLASPAQMMATVQQLNHNLEMLQGAELLGRLDRLNTNLETWGPELQRFTDALTTFAERMWGPKAG